MSILEVVVAAGLVGIVALGAAIVSQNLSTSAITNERAQTQTSLLYELDSYLNGSVACSGFFASTPIVGTTKAPLGSPLGQLLPIFPAAAKVATTLKPPYNVGWPYNGLVVSSVLVNPNSLPTCQLATSNAYPAGTNLCRGILELQGTKVGTVYGGNPFVTDINFYYSTAPGTNFINGCLSSAPSTAATCISLGGSPIPTTQTCSFCASAGLVPNGNGTCAPQPTPPPCPAGTSGLCSYPILASGFSGGACTTGSTGTCTVSCLSGKDTLVQNTCVLNPQKPAPTPASCPAGSGGAGPCVYGQSISGAPGVTGTCTGNSTGSCFVTCIAGVVTINDNCTPPAGCAGGRDGNYCNYPSNPTTGSTVVGACLAPSTGTCTATCITSPTATVTDTCAAAAPTATPANCVWAGVTTRVGSGCHGDSGNSGCTITNSNGSQAPVPASFNFNGGNLSALPAAPGQSVFCFDCVSDNDRLIQTATASCQ